jgi:hypothetical protein
MSVFVIFHLRGGKAVDAASLLGGVKRILGGCVRASAQPTSVRGRGLNSEKHTGNKYQAYERDRDNSKQRFGHDFSPVYLHGAMGRVL